MLSMFFSLKVIDELLQGIVFVSIRHSMINTFSDRQEAKNQD